MSLESDIKRIADALEKMILCVNNPSTARIGTGTETVTLATVATEALALPTTGAELKAFAQKLAADIPDTGIAAFTAAVREIVATAGVKRLAEVPLDKIATVALALIKYKEK